MLIHYSGHGIEIDKQNFLLPADIPNPESGDSELLKSESLPLSTLVDTVKEKGAGVRIFIIDACRDNPFAKAGKRALGTTRGLAAVEPPQGSFIMYSAGTGQSALDRLNENDSSPTSVYTRILLSRFDKKGLALRDLAADVRKEVAGLAKSVGHEQSPAYYDEMTVDFSFLPGEPAKTDTSAPPQNDQDEARQAWESVKDLNSIAALEIVASRYPTSVFGEMAKSRAAELKAAQATPIVKPVEEVITLAPPKPKPPKPKPIPQTEDQASLESGDAQPEDVSRGTRLRWVVILGSFPKTQKAKANARLSAARNFGIDALIIDTDNYAGLADGYYSVVISGGSRNNALSLLPNARAFRGDAYVKLSQ